MPAWPCCANLYFEGAIGNRAWPLVIVVSRWPIADRVGKVLVEHGAHLGLVVEEVHLRRAAVHVQIDGPPGLGREMRQPRQTAGRGRLACRRSSPCSVSASRVESAAVPRLRARCGRKNGGASSDRSVREAGSSSPLRRSAHPLEIASSRFKITFAIIVQAASDRPGWSRGPGPVSPVASNCLAAPGWLV